MPETFGPDVADHDDSESSSCVTWNETLHNREEFFIMLIMPWAGECTCCASSNSFLLVLYAIPHQAVQALTMFRKA